MLENKLPLSDLLFGNQISMSIRFQAHKAKNSKHSEDLLKKGREEERRAGGEERSLRFEANLKIFIDIYHHVTIINVAIPIDMFSNHESLKYQI